MYTLRLILKGVIFLTVVKDTSGQDQLWLLLLDPGHKTAIHHEARLYVDPRFKDALSRSFDGTDVHGRSYFDLPGDHLTASFANPPQPASIFFAKDTKVAGEKKPCFGCGNPFTFRQQKDDVRWVNTFSEILKNTPLKPGHTLPMALELRKDIVDGSYYTDGLILSRVVLGGGEIRTYTLWGEKGDPSNLISQKISTFVFKRSDLTCAPLTDPHSAVAEVVAIELGINGAFTLSSRSLPNEMKPGRGNIVLKGTAGSLVEVELSSMRHDAPPSEGDFNAFYELLKHPEYFQFLPLPVLCTGTDSGGACSPARP